jgi:tryptophan synthase alpha subunit
MKNETLEEAAERYIDCFEFGIAHPRRVAKNAFINGAKYQAERMYSEEEVIELLQKYRYDLSSGKTANIGDTTKFWFEQFKKEINYEKRNN